MQVLQAEERTELNKSVRNQLRKQGRIPAVVYGQSIGNKPVDVLANDVQRLLKEEGRNALFGLKVNDAKPTVMIKDIQRDVIKGDILHIDFIEVDLTEEMTVAVPVVTEGESLGEKKGGVLQRAIQEVEVTCLPSVVPEAITVDVSQLDIGENITVADLQLDEGVTLNLEPDTVLVTVTRAQAEEEAKDAEESAEADESAAEAGQEEAEAEAGE